MSGRRTLGVVGEASPRGARPWSGRSGSALAKLFARELPDLRRRVLLTNALTRWPGKASKGDRFPRRIRPAELEALLHRLDGCRLVVVAGRRAARVVRPGLERVPYMTWAWFRRGHRLWAVIPHPSGVDRWYNEPAHRAAAAAFLRSALMSQELLSSCRALDRYLSSPA